MVSMVSARELTTDASPLELLVAMTYSGTYLVKYALPLY
jgi:hypothetical protein